MIFVVPKTNFQKLFSISLMVRNSVAVTLTVLLFGAPKNKVDVVVFVVILEAG